jgi:5'-3' exonuclease
MTIRSLVDGDNLAFACAASAEDADEAWIACSRAQHFMETILQSTGATEYEVWLSGPNNFRYNVYPEYKANRKDAYRPKWEKEVKDYLTLEWNANWSEGCEADDMLGVRLTELGSEAILCHLDKDMNQIAGKHFNWAIIRLGVVVREAKIYDVSPEEGDRFFWEQVLTGDKATDNIPGIHGIGPKKAKQILLGATTNAEAYERVAEAYGSEEELDMNAQCIYIWRKPNDSWRNLIVPNC